MARVFVTRSIPNRGLDLLAKAGITIEMYEKDEAIPQKELGKRLLGCDAVVSLLSDTLDAEMMDAAGPNLKLIANYAVGYDNVDVEAAKKRGIVVTNTPVPEASEAVADHAFALLIALAHRIVESDAYARAEKYKGWSPDLLVGADVHGKTLGVIGAGRIGLALATRAVKGFGMRCLYSDRQKNPTFEEVCGGLFTPFSNVLKESDFISLHVPLLPTTRHLISTAEFALMKKSAFLINTARGPIVDEKALLRALKTGRIAGAGLDVFECEPAIDCDLTDTLELKSFPNVILTPHTASATVETRDAMSRLVAENIIAVLGGKPAISPV